MGVLYLFGGLLLNFMFVVVVMSLSFVLVFVNVLRLRWFKLIVKKG